MRMPGAIQTNRATTRSLARDPACAGCRVSRQSRMASDNAASELARLRELVDELRHAVRARDDFLAIAAHELRNPMTPILGVAELALITAQSEGTCSPRLVALLESMQRLV